MYSPTNKTHKYDVSVVTPTYNRAKLLPRVWDSLKQQKINFEWIVVDDGSTDNTEGVVNSFNEDKINYFRFKENRGVNAARNAGAAQARGRYVVFLDSDDKLYPDALGSMLEIMDAAEDDIGVAGFACIIAETGELTSEVNDGQILCEHDIVCKDALRGGDKILIYRKSVLDEYKLPEELLGCEQVFVYECSKKWKFLMVNKPLSIIYRQSDNLSNAKSVVKRSADIAKSFEMLVSNHAEILSKNADVEFRFLKKALYRYGVAGSRINVLRIYRKIIKNHSIYNVLIASVCMPFCLLGIGYFEIWRVNRLNKKFIGIGSK